ncbi:hypothetical protein CO051_07420 [Candidatus Roizmanbacteria bacterium CG_4_9_14_0_2_um_filter_39_13]|uniref:Mannosylglycerate hydrolase MGH1-like glycoside hydrolase domain-containing protein n=2 Tax=Candidatus Roizmaniibacteriota TaxID=1752723 RepID=A0A2M8EW68_9BACT|nr:MAG: hypothetical protein COY15_02565 [Candidatus Roizmanbacteria bacterium CG_4_10_14_0_2_um_filter_39_12]PJC30099.1 MAG: hypothetical protein CO051_07420 [Candidatus Roizmanbacteria bacterium CG_4_9_14_0_2_um_filter_39_13]PJE61858.1 MAG: hypothetical protein COU87_02370 [Candidatus Roizmanbacteria bacterium CG10_big_fil_rev_8_21_14_0_10_39_12]
MTINPQDKKLMNEIREFLLPKKHYVKRRAQGYLKHDYLVPGGYYSEQWDWDAFFIGVALASEISSEAIYLKNWALNYFTIVKDDGYAPACITSKGPETNHRAMLTKPFIAQGALLASRFLQDFSWIKPNYAKLVKMVLYREKNLWSKEFDLPVWGNWMESGADNNPSILNFEPGTVIACDLSTFVYRNYLAMSKIAYEFNIKKDATFFKKRASEIKLNMQKYLWDQTDDTFYNFSTINKQFIKHHSYSNMVPLWEHIASDADGKKMIKKYIINPKKMWAKYGIRTLSKDDKLYNQKNIIHPYSNWQGPVWPICNYLHMWGLLQYGFKKEAIDVARKITKICINDLKKTGGMHEDYNAETGKPLAADNFVSWNLLVGNMILDCYNNSNPFQIK